MKQAGAFVASLVASLLLCSSAAGASYNVYVCGPWSSGSGPFVPAAVPGTEAVAIACGASGDAAALSLAKYGLQAVPNGQGASWTTTAPAGLTITHIYTVNDTSSGVGDGQGWWGEFYWEGGPSLTGRSAPINDNFSGSGCCA